MEFFHIGPEKAELLRAISSINLLGAGSIFLPLPLYPNMISENPILVQKTLYQGVWVYSDGRHILEITRWDSKEVGKTPYNLDRFPLVEVSGALLRFKQPVRDFPQHHLSVPPPWAKQIVAKADFGTLGVFPSGSDIGSTTTSTSYTALLFPPFRPI